MDDGRDDHDDHDDDGGEDYSRGHDCGRVDRNQANLDLNMMDPMSSHLAVYSIEIWLENHPALEGSPPPLNCPYCPWLHCCLNYCRLTWVAGVVDLPVMDR